MELLLSVGFSSLSILLSLIFGVISRYKNGFGKTFGSSSARFNRGINFKTKQHSRLSANLTKIIWTIAWVGIAITVVRSMASVPDLISKLSIVSEWVQNLGMKEYMIGLLVLVTVLTGVIFSEYSFFLFLAITTSITFSIGLIWVSIVFVKIAYQAPSDIQTSIVIKDICFAFISVTLGLHAFVYSFGGLLGKNNNKIWPKIIDYPYYVTAAALLVIIAISIQSNVSQLRAIAGYEIVVGIIVVNLKIMKTSVEMFECFRHPTELIRTLPVPGLKTVLLKADKKA